MGMLNCFILFMFLQNIMYANSCYTDFDFNVREIGESDCCYETYAMAAINSNITAIAYISHNDIVNTSIKAKRCLGYSTRLHVKICSNVSCKDVDICKVTSKKNDYLSNDPYVYDIIISSSKAYILSSGYGPLDIYTCNLSFTKCEVQSPYIDIGSDFSGTYSSPNLYIIYSDLYYNNIVFICGASTCQSKNMTVVIPQISVPSYYPIVTVVNDKIHISYVSNDYSSIVLYTCDKEIMNCYKAGEIYGKTYLGIAGLGFNVAVYGNNLYVAFSNNYGSYGDLSIALCDLSSDGSIKQCSKRIDDGYGDKYIIGGLRKPHIAFAEYLGAVVAVSNIIGLGATKDVAITRVNMDLSSDSQVFYTYGFGGYTDAVDTTSGGIYILDIDPSTARMKISLQQTKTSGAIITNTIYLIDAYLFPSLKNEIDWYTYQSGYSTFFSQGTCSGKVANEVITCTSTLDHKSKKCTQQIVFNGGDFTSQTVNQECNSKSGRGVSKVYPRGTNPHSQNACVSSNYYFDDGPSVPLEAALVLDILLYVLVRETTSVYWRGGVVQNLCYHNTVKFSGYNKDKCDDLALTTWKNSCGTTVNSIIFDTIKTAIITYAVGTFDIADLIISVIVKTSCDDVAYLYYAFLKTDDATPGYLATNSKVTIPSLSKIYENTGGNTDLSVSMSVIKSIVSTINEYSIVLPNNTLSYNSTQLIPKLNSIPPVVSMSMPKPTLALVPMQKPKPTHRPRPR